jgi:hypothetical protein
MAQASSLIKLRGTLFGITFVNSKTYGKHVRAARGTYKPVQVNDTFKKMSGHLVAAQKPARVIKEAIDPYRIDFKGGMLWNRLVSLFTLQHKNNESFNLQQLEGFEIFQQYPLQRFFKIDTTVTAEKETASLKVVLTYKQHPTFPRAKFIDAYSLQVIGIFPNLTAASAESVAADAQIISRTGKVEALSFHLPIPPGATDYLVCVKLDGISKGSVMAGHFTKGMSILKAGTIDHTASRTPEDQAKEYKKPRTTHPRVLQKDSVPCSSPPAASGTASGHPARATIPLSLLHYPIRHRN